MTSEDFFSNEIIVIDKKTSKEKERGFLENIKSKFEDDIEQKWVSTYSNRGTKCVPICHEPNKQEPDFCFKCNWVISKKGIQEVREKMRQQQRKLMKKIRSFNQ